MTNPAYERNAYSTQQPRKTESSHGVGLCTNGAIAILCKSRREPYAPADCYEMHPCRRRSPDRVRSWRFRGTNYVQPNEVPRMAGRKYSQRYVAGTPALGWAHLEREE